MHGMHNTPLNYISTAPVPLQGNWSWTGVNMSQHEKPRDGPAKKWINHRHVLPREPLRIETWNLEALTLTQHGMRRRKSILKFQDIFISRLDLDEILAKTRKHQLFNTQFVIKSSFPMKAKNWGDIAEDPTRRPILVSVPNSPPTKRYRKTRFPYITQVITIFFCFSAMPC